MIGQYLSNTNENATVSISQNFSELNKALVILAKSNVNNRAKCVAINQVIYKSQII